MIEYNTLSLKVMQKHKSRKIMPIFRRDYTKINNQKLDRLNY